MDNGNLNKLWGCALVVWMTAVCWAGDAAGFVKVEWSERSGEKWTIEGLADRETGRPMAKDSVFAICSNTKPITSTLVLTFVEEGKLNLDDPVSKYLPEFIDIKLKGQSPKQPLLLKHLITHLSGLAYSANTKGRKADRMPLTEQVAFALSKGLSYEPGDHYQYNGLGFSVMGAILEKITGRRVDELMKERIFDPLEMTEATFYPDERLMARAAVVYNYPKDGSAPTRVGFGRWSAPLEDRTRTPMLAGGLFCTTGDYLKFSQMIARKGLGINGKRIISEEIFDRYLATRQTPPGDSHDTSFDIAFNKEHTGGSKGGLYATSASWNWGNKSCVLLFRAKSAKIPDELKKPQKKQ